MSEGRTALPSSITVDETGLSGPPEAFGHIIADLHQRAPRELYAEYLRDPAIRAAARPTVQRGAADALHQPAERRLAILVADLEGYSRICETTRPEQLWDIMSDWWRDVADAVYGQLGWLNKVDGDGVMAVFGLHARMADPATHAAACALDVTAGFEAFAAGVESFGRNGVGIRLGVETGDVVAGVTVLGPQPVYHVVGHAVSFAYQLEAAATENSALVGPQTHELTRDEYEYADAGAVQVKGTDVSANIYRLLRRR